MTVTGSSIVSVAQSYEHTPYKFGGFLPSTGWDCSGAMNYWLGRQLRMVLPGGYRWSGRSHGPVAAEYLAWTAAVTVLRPQIGDLCCWDTHIGVYLGEGNMFSAFSKARGTVVTPVSWGPRGEVLSYRRIATVATVTDSGAQVETVSGPAAGAGCATQTLMLPALIPLTLLRRWAWQRRTR